MIMYLSIPLFGKVQARLDAVTGLTRENLTGVRVIRAFCREEEAVREFDASNAQLTKLNEFVGKLSALLNPVTYVLINIATVILINNAGMSDSKPITDYTSDHFEKIMKLNVGAAMNCIMPTVKIMKEQGGGCILNTSSMVSICGQPSGVAYPVSKSAVNGMTWSLARELGPSNIRVNAVAPGITKTDMVAALTKRNDRASDQCHPDEKSREPKHCQCLLSWQAIWQAM